MKTKSETTAKPVTPVPLADKFAFTDHELVQLGYWSRTTLWRLRRDDPAFPPKKRGRTSADAIREYFGGRQQAA